MNPFCYLSFVCHAFLSVHCSIVFTCWKGSNLLALLYVMFSLCFCYFLMWCPGLGVVLDCINFQYIYIYKGLLVIKGLLVN